MMASDVCMAVRDLLRADGYEAHYKRLDRFTGFEGLCVRPGADRTDMSYYDGVRTIDCAVQVISCSRSEQTACEAAEAVAESFDGRMVAGGWNWISTVVAGLPQPLPLDDGNWYAYSLRLTVRIEKEGW